MAPLKRPAGPSPATQGVKRPRPARPSHGRAAADEQPPPLDGEACPHLSARACDRILSGRERNHPRGVCRRRAPTRRTSPTSRAQPGATAAACPASRRLRPAPSRAVRPRRQRRRTQKRPTGRRTPTTPTPAPRRAPARACLGPGPGTTATRPPLQPSAQF